MLHTKFISSVRWNSFEALLYQIILMGNQAFLLKVLDCKMYGLVGVLFSLLYMVVMATNGGLDLTLGPLFTRLSKDKSTIKKILLPHVLVQPCIITIILMVIALAKACHVSAFLNHLSFHAIGILGLLAYSESIKKTLRVLLHLLFRNRITALIETITIAIYATSILFFYSIGWHLTIELIFLPLLVTSCLGALYAGYIAYGWYATLPTYKVSHHDSIDSKKITHSMVRNRFWNYGIQLGHTLFSGNFLISLFGLHFGLEQAGIAKFANTLAHGIATIVRKMFDTSSSSYLAHIKNQDAQTKKTVFAYISRSMGQVNYSIFACAGIIMSTWWALQGNNMNHTTIMLMSMLCALHFFELLYLVYEKWYINEEKSEYLFASYVIPALILLGVYSYTASHLTIPTLLAVLLMMRIISLMIVMSLSYVIWNIPPLWHISSFKKQTPVSIETDQS